MNCARQTASRAVNRALRVLSLTGVGFAVMPCAFGDDCAHRMPQVREIAAKVEMCSCLIVLFAQADTATDEASSRNDSAKGSRAIPRSVMMALTYREGVTSNAGFSTRTPSGVTCLPA